MGLPSAPVEGKGSVSRNVGKEVVSLRGRLSWSLCAMAIYRDQVVWSVSCSSTRAKMAGLDS